MIAFERLGVVLAPDREPVAKFNAGMIAVDGVVHMLYRLTEKGPRWYGRPIDWLQYEIDRDFPYVRNCICYARLDTTGRLLADATEPVIAPGPGMDRLGCEDARIVAFEGTYFIFFCAYDGIMPRVGIARTSDFKDYVKIGVVPCPYPDKDAFIFPRRIGGRIAYVHRVPPGIQVDYFDCIETLMAPESWEGYGNRLEQSTVLRGVYDFEQSKIGGGVPPIETDLGWLMLYHGVDSAGRYHVAAALMDPLDPRRVLARLPYPLLSPSAPYEAAGDYVGCVFPQGYFLRDGRLFLSYGAGDKCTALAQIELAGLLTALREHAASTAWPPPGS